MFVIGTAHLSTRSAEDVRRVVAAVRPENVVVELCKGRAAIMYQDQGQGGQQQLTMPGADAGAGGEAGGQQRQEQPGGSATTAASSANAKASNPLNLSGSSLVGAISRSLALGGRDALLLRAALASLSGSLSARLGVVSGGEFVAARQAAELIDAQVVLGACSAAQRQSRA